MASRVSSVVLLLNVVCFVSPYVFSVSIFSFRTVFLLSKKEEKKKKKKSRWRQSQI